MAIKREKTTDKYLLNRLQFSGLPQKNGSRGRVPQVKSVKIAQYEAFPTRHEFTIVFEEPIAPELGIESYAIFCKGLTDSDVFVNVGETHRSPAKIIIPVGGTLQQTLVFGVQVVLKNGYSSDPETSLTDSILINLA